MKKINFFNKIYNILLIFNQGTKLRLDYQFLGERTETIRIDALLSKREIGIREDLYGELGLQFSSYPHLNFFTDVKYMVILLSFFLLF